MESAMTPILIVGSYLSPYVRKVLACLEVKSMAYEVDHIVPFFGDDRFSKLSPLRRIPVLVDGDLVLSDSSVICQYLEDKQADPALFPRDIADRARARWLEEFADTRMGDVFIWRFFNQIAIRPSVWGEKGDRDMVDRTLKEEIPTVLDYLEGEAPAEGFRFGSTLSVADVAIAAFFRNAGWVRFQIDAARWPKAAGWIGRTLASPAFAKLAKIEDAVLRVPIAEQRNALKTIGAPISAETYATSAPRRGIMPL
jgi:glutathione S-transferase